ncbi:uncharacterized protein LOC125177972 [Hyalella azteca]|uniref:Uncharacterized protein LOC125177972 n=1 Tax=Hyalella azteca TaxID=294128 RepID=A0A979FJG9_HYAAZ|nr:uncharacterized protein LOC125177972 [Hyalella azteca]
MAGRRAAWLLLVAVLACTTLRQLVHGAPGFAISEREKINYLQLATNFSLPTNLTTVSYCLHFKLLFLGDEASNILFLYPLSIVVVASQELYFSEGKSLMYMVLDFEVKMREWVHLCVSVFGGSKVYINGVEKRTTMINNSPSPMEKTEKYVFSFCSNYEVKSSSDMDCGVQVSVPVVLPRQIFLEEVTQLAQCLPPPTDNVVAGLAWQETRNLLDPKIVLTRDVKLDPATNNGPWAPLNSSYSSSPAQPEPAVKVLDLDPCAAPTSVLHYLGTGGFTYDEAASWCKKFSGVLPSANHTEMKSIWDALMVKRSDFQFWLKNKSQNNICYLAVQYDNSKDRQMELACNNTMSKLLVCEIPENATFSALGEKMDTFGKFYLDRDGLQSLYRSRYRDSIALNSENTEYQVNKTGKLLFSARKPEQALDVPMGLFRSHRPGAPNDDQPIVISACAEEEFTCNNGSCIPLDQHCDGLQQCPDFEDENCKPNIYPVENYDNTRASNTTLPIKLGVNISSVSDVEIGNGRIKIKIYIKTSWKDERIEFVQLQEELERNIISEDIWYPKYHFETLVFEDERDYYQGNNSISRLMAARGNTTTIKTYKTQRKRQYKAEIVHIEITAFTLLCDFDLAIYPFGVHPCMFNITLDDQSDNGPYFNVSATQLELKEQRMSLFMVHHSCFQAPNSSTPRTITITVR